MKVYSEQEVRIINSEFNRYLTLITETHKTMMSIISEEGTRLREGDLNICPYCKKSIRTISPKETTLFKDDPRTRIKVGG